LAAQPPWSDWPPSKFVGAPPKSERCRFEHGDTLADHGYRPPAYRRRARETAPIKPAGSAAYLVQTDAVWDVREGQRGTLTGAGHPARILAAAEEC